MARHQARVEAAVVISESEIDAALTRLGFPPPAGHLRDVQAIVATEMGLHRRTVRVRLDGDRCVVEVPAEDLDERRRSRAPHAAREAMRCAAKGGAIMIEIVSYAPR